MIWKSRMVLAAPGPLLTPPPSSSPPKTPFRSYSTQIRSQNEEKNPTIKLEQSRKVWHRLAEATLKIGGIAGQPLILFEHRRLWRSRSKLAIKCLDDLMSLPAPATTDCVGRPKLRTTGTWCPRAGYADRRALSSTFSLCHCQAPADGQRQVEGRGDCKSALNVRESSEHTKMFPLKTCMSCKNACWIL